MLGKVLKKIVGTSNDRELRQMGKVVKKINIYENSQNMKAQQSIMIIIEKYFEISPSQ